MCVCTLEINRMYLAHFDGYSRKREDTRAEWRGKGWSSRGTEVRLIVEPFGTHIRYFFSFFQFQIKSLSCC